MNIKVLLVDDHKLMRIGLRSLIEKQSDMDVVAEAQDGREAIAMSAQLKPDVVIMDIGMPNLNGIEATRQILAEHPTARIIALSMHSDRRFVSGMLEAGALGYLLKDCAFEELIHAIKTIMNNQTYLSPDITGVVIQDYIRQLSAEETSAFGVLTAREREVLQLLAEGKTTKQIASLLYVSAKTVETHRSQIMEKLKIHSVAELTKFAIREGLTPLDG